MSTVQEAWLRPLLPRPSSSGCRIRIPPSILLLTAEDRLLAYVQSIDARVGKAYLGAIGNLNSPEGFDRELAVKGLALAEAVVRKLAK